MESQIRHAAGGPPARDVYEVLRGGIPSRAAVGRRAGVVTTRDYDDVMSGRRTRLGPDAAKQAEVFERAYDIALQVSDLRERHGLTQQQLAALCGIDQADISRIERGSTSPTTRTLQRIAEALDADVRLVSRAS
jgi:DNA-binding XRE family transcriptional regulator